ncbi:hypothetical protein FHS15_003908 [Paenibacillus castaneae]|nr:hypothetical protein [Paenibacillus castaneae]
MDKQEVNSLTRIIEIYELLRKDGEISSVELAHKYGKHIETY